MPVSAPPDHVAFGPSGAAPAPVAQTGRFDRLDALRGLAIVWMASFHFCFDLNHYRLMPPQNFYLDPFWTLQRVCIVSLFLLCAGMGQAVALESGQGWPRFWRRWAQVAGCAVLVSAGSALMFPASWISFGVLHGIAVMLLIVRLVVPAVLRRPGGPGALALLCVVGAVAWVLPHGVKSPFFDTRATDWVGLVTHLPVTEDYAPVLPWLGMVLWGVAAGLWLLRRHRSRLAGPVPAPLRPLALLGRWPLTFYMVHQPLLIGAVLLWLQWARH